MSRRQIIPLLVLPVLQVSVAAEESGDLVGNGGFESLRGGLPSAWNPIWTRAPDAGRMTLDADVRRSGKHSARIEHRGREDWSLDPDVRLQVEPGDMFRLEAWVKVKGQGRTTICVVTYDGRGKVRDWVFGGCTATGPRDWHRLSSNLVVPGDVGAIHPRLIGYGPATVWVDDFSLVRRGNVTDLRPPALPEKLSLNNASLSLDLRTADGTFSVTDKRNGHTWEQRSSAPFGVVLDAKGTSEIEMTWLHVPSGEKIATKIQLDGDKPEVSVSLAATGEIREGLKYPQPFVSEAGSYLVVPLNEGISYPVEDRSIRPRRLVAYGGHGICMGFWGVTDGGHGHMGIIETPDDAAIRVARLEGKLCIAPEWDPQKGRLGYERRLRYIFFDRGGHVAMCKRYRAHAKKVGLLKTLKEKRKENPHVDLLVGAVNVWCWERDAFAVVREMKSLGIERILWSHRRPPEVVRALNELTGVLTSRYDIYQDLMDPRIVKEKLRGAHSDWPQAGWPHDVMVDARGDWRRGWRVKGRDGNMYPCGVLCDRQALQYARKRVPKELETHPYRSRFIDTTTASPWRECYHPDHPMTRSDSRHWKMELLRFMSKDMRLVTGSETGHEAAAPYVHYFEGMLSLGPYRVPDAGRRMMQVVEEVPERVARFQVGHEYRLPLWELVYHDCVVAQWYWGDYNNKLPALWEKRDLFNILYGTPPMFMFNRSIWAKNKKRFVRSYKNVCPVARAVGYAEMVDHRFLTSDRTVQQTVFANGIEVTVNFGDNPFLLPAGKKVLGQSFLFVAR